jgi:hypothetical protein
VTLTAGAWTTILSTGPFVALSPGFYFPVMYYNIVIGSGASAPVGFTAGISVNNGAVYTQNAYDYRLFVANGFISLAGALPGPAASGIWFGAGATVQLQGYSFTNASTAEQNGTWALVQIFRAPDQ